MRLALNRLAEKGQWDFEELKLELEELVLESAPIELTGFSFTEIDQVILGDEPEAVGGGAPGARHQRKALSIRIGDVFVLGQHRLACGDLTESSRPGQVVPKRPSRAPGPNGCTIQR